MGHWSAPLGEWIGGYAYAGLIGVLFIVLFLTIYCIRRQLCCCQKKAKPPDKADVHLLKKLSADTEDDFKPPYGNVTVTRPVGDGWPHYKGKPYQSDTTTSDMSGDDGHLVLPDTHVSVKTGGPGSTASDGKSSKMKQDMYIDGLNEITGMPNKASGGYDYIRVSITLLPEKKYRSKTKLHFVGEEDVVVFGDSFKFNHVSRNDLLQCAFRFRLYAKKSITREICVGEMFIQLADVVQRVGGFVTTKMFGRKKIL